jgi:hypothetical protein
MLAPNPSQYLESQNPVSENSFLIQTSCVRQVQQIGHG